MTTMIFIININITLLLIIFILVNILIAGGPFETRRTPTLMSINEVNTLLELRASHALAVVNVLLGKGR